ncbi:BolA/IbaG family iron-sulfur metabolism protein [Colwellia sp. D2M02]|uniref:BolA family iron metabolism protein IbaG n=1 Tax=Colwellia asteriadis TaxID=517723 RepID=A0ABN1L3B0_9GAMM|nr:BolA/IbaG family iron-sulfur metabolism protein [Colwellia sp. D2M02]MBU2893559.1 BolA/IbaG family iron-sulfur metabolism protein [Colwellia sp. D2M02]
MEISEVEVLIKQRVTEALELDEIQVKFDGSQCRIIAVSDMFDDLSRVKRQQAVLKPLAELIKDGSVHAVSVKTYNKAQWQRDKMFNSL